MAKLLDITVAVCRLVRVFIVLLLMLFILGVYFDAMEGLDGDDSPNEEAHAKLVEDILSRGGQVPLTSPAEWHSEFDLIILVTAPVHNLVGFEDAKLVWLLVRAL